MFTFIVFLADKISNRFFAEDSYVADPIEILQRKIRSVSVPEIELEQAKNNIDTLELIWKYGQNDFQPKHIRSLVVGDIIKKDSELYLIEAMGFRKLSFETS